MPPLRLSCRQVRSIVRKPPKSTLTPLSAALVILPSTITLSPGPASSGWPASVSTLTVSPQVGPRKMDCSIRSRRALAPVMATASTWQGGVGFATFEDEPPQDVLRPVEPEDLPPAGAHREDDATRLCTTIEGVDDDPVAEEAHAGGPTVPGAVRATAIVRDVKRAGRLQEVYPLRGNRTGEGIR